MCSYKRALSLHSQYIMSTVISSYIELTKSVGTASGGNQEQSFTDVFRIGGFPSAQNIQRITEIQVYSENDAQDAAVVVGLKITYKLSNSATPAVVSHGNVHADSVGDFTVSDHQILVGVYGHLKGDTQPTKGRVAEISFVLFDQTKAEVSLKGPYRGTSVALGTPWATFGEIIAFQGTSTDQDGLLSLGFTLAKAAV
jgi:hypothetical protein